MLNTVPTANYRLLWLQSASLWLIHAHCFSFDASIFNAVEVCLVHCSMPVRFWTCFIGDNVYLQYTVSSTTHEHHAVNFLQVEMFLLVFPISFYWFLHQTAVKLASCCLRLSDLLQNCQILPWFCTADPQSFVFFVSVSGAYLVLGSPFRPTHKKLWTGVDCD